MTMRVLIATIAIIYTSMTSASADTLYCSDWQGIRTCADAHGYVSHETEWQGMTNGWDNWGNTWSTSRWRDTTTVTPSER
jgi:hypothetical protein